jgi:cytochrome c-type biogenesis protein CcmF
LRLSGGLTGRKEFLGLVVCAHGSGIILWALGYRQPTALVASAAAVGLIYSTLMLLKNKSVLKSPPMLGSLSAHFGMALITIGVAFSGPYATDKDIMLSEGQSDRISAYTATLLALDSGRRPGYEYIAARVQIQKDEKILGIVEPERRIYDKFGKNQFSEVDTIPSLGEEIYASLLGLDEERRVLVKISVKPLVNWLWIGGAILSLLPLLCLWRRKPGLPESGTPEKRPF